MSASSDSRGTKPLFWRVRDALGQDKQKAPIIKKKMLIIFVCLLPVRFLLTSITVFFVPREWLAAKGLLSLWTHAKPHGWFSLATESGAVAERLSPSQKQNSNS